MYKIGLYFGSFNPIHNGHIGIAKYCLDKHLIDDLYFMVSPQNPFKSNSQLLDFKYRFKMVDLVCDEHPEFFACDLENSLDKPSYTAYTVQHMNKINPNIEYVLIMGADNFVSLDSWKESDYIKSLPMIIIPRPNVNKDSFDEHISMLESIKNEINEKYSNDRIVIAKDIEIKGISSTIIREKIKEGLEIEDFVPKCIKDFIIEHGLYLK